MLSYRRIICILVIIFIALCVFSGILFVNEDRSPPEITLPSHEVSYKNGEDTAVLLEGVTAKDNIDGDLSSAVDIDIITLMSDDNRAWVKYVVIDSNGNVGTAKRQIVLLNSETSASVKVSPSPKNTQASAPPASIADPTPTPNPEIPIIILKKDFDTIKVGKEIPLLDYVDTVTDNEDTREELFRKISIIEEVDFYTEGEYILYYHVTDSVGNDSLSAKFVLTIEK